MNKTLKFTAISISTLAMFSFCACSNGNKTLAKNLDNTITNLVYSATNLDFANSSNLTSFLFSDDATQNTDNDNNLNTYNLNNNESNNQSNIYNDRYFYTDNNKLKNSTNFNECCPQPLCCEYAYCNDNQRTLYANNNYETQQETLNNRPNTPSKFTPENANQHNTKQNDNKLVITEKNAILQNNNGNSSVKTQNRRNFNNYYTNNNSINYNNQDSIRKNNFTNYTTNSGEYNTNNFDNYNNYKTVSDNKNFGYTLDSNRSGNPNFRDEFYHTPMSIENVKNNHQKPAYFSSTENQATEQYNEVTSSPLVSFSTETLNTNNSEIQNLISLLINKRSNLLLYINDLYKGNIKVSSTNSSALNAYMNILKDNTSYFNQQRGIVLNQLEQAKQTLSSDSASSLVNAYIIRSNEALATRIVKLESSIQAMDSILSILKGSENKSSQSYLTNNFEVNKKATTNNGGQTLFNKTGTKTNNATSQAQTSNNAEQEYLTLNKNTNFENLYNNQQKQHNSELPENDLSNIVHNNDALKNITDTAQGNLSSNTKISNSQNGFDIEKTNRQNANTPDPNNNEVINTPPTNNNLASNQISDYHDPYFGNRFTKHSQNTANNNLNYSKKSNFDNKNINKTVDICENGNCKSVEPTYLDCENGSCPDSQSDTQNCVNGSCEDINSNNLDCKNGNCPDCQSGTQNCVNGNCDKQETSMKEQNNTNTQKNKKSVYNISENNHSYTDNLMNFSDEKPTLATMDNNRITLNQSQNKDHNKIDEKQKNKIEEIKKSQNNINPKARENQKEIQETKSKLDKNALKNKLSTQISKYFLEEKNPKHSRLKTLK